MRRKGVGILSSILVISLKHFFFSISAAAAAAGLSNPNAAAAAAGTPNFNPNASAAAAAAAAAAGGSPYVITPQDQQYLAALASAGQLLPGKLISYSGLERPLTYVTKTLSNPSLPFIGSRRKLGNDSDLHFECSKIGFAIRNNEAFFPSFQVIKLDFKVPKMNAALETLDFMLA